MTNSRQTTLTSSRESQFRKSPERRLKARSENDCPVKISDISERGFRLQVLDRDYFLTRERYPYFSDATEEEILDVALHGELICWESLDLHFELEQLDHPEEGYCFSQIVRGVPRPDLFASYHRDENGYALIPKQSAVESS